MVIEPLATVPMLDGVIKPTAIFLEGKAAIEGIGEVIS
jgi:hypothetical protein